MRILVQMAFSSVAAMTTTTAVSLFGNGTNISGCATTVDFTEEWYYYGPGMSTELYLQYISTLSQYKIFGSTHVL